MAEENAIQVNFGKPMPLFPLDSAVLLPQQVLPLHIFEPRYVQMVQHALDGSGQIAMAVFRGADWKKSYHGRPQLRPAVCIGQIVQHEKLPENRFNILLQGVCRARIVEELEPSLERLYRAAYLEPLGSDEDDEQKLYGVRERFRELLSDEPLARLTMAAPLLKHIRDDEVPTAVIVELLSFAIPTSRETRYKLLAEGDIGERAGLVEHELLGLGRLISRAVAQRPEPWPKGMSWN